MQIVYQDKNGNREITAKRFYTVRDGRKFWNAIANKAQAAGLVAMRSHNRLVLTSGESYTIR